MPYRCPSTDVFLNLDYDPALLDVTAETDGTITIEFSDGVTPEDAGVGLFYLDDPTPRTIAWEIEALTGVMAFGLDFGDSSGVLGSGLYNAYYVSDGRVVIDGSVVGGGPPLQVGDTLLLWFDPVNNMVAWYINGDRVA